MNDNLLRAITKGISEMRRGFAGSLTIFLNPAELDALVIDVKNQPFCSELKLPLKFHGCELLAMNGLEPEHFIVGRGYTATEKEN